jgi:uncharacterized protein (TIGR03086 family)
MMITRPDPTPTNDRFGRSLREDDMTAPGSHTEPLDLLARALDATGRLVEAVAPEQWQLPTGCPEWTVRALLSHVVAGNRVFTGLLRGGPFPTAEQLQELRDNDQLGDDPVASYHAVGAVMQDAFSQPDVMDRPCASPFGAMPGVGLLHIRVTELLVHGWDIARATGQPADFPDDVVALELSIARPQFADRPPGGSRFAAPQPVADDAPAIDQLAGLLGRDVADPAR